MATLERCVIALNGIKGPNWSQTEDASIKPSYLIQKGTADYQVKICATGGVAIGVADCDIDHDLNTAYASGIAIPWWRLHSGVEINILYDDGTNNATIAMDTELIRSATDAGCASSWAYSDGSEASDTISTVIGRCSQDTVITGDVATFIPVILS